jgi:DNA processing protein
LEELEALLILNSIPLLGSYKIRLLMKHYGSAAAVLKAPLEEIKTFPGFGSKILLNWNEALDKRKWENNLKLVEKLQAKIIPFTSPDYPKRLLETEDYPVVLFAQGSILKNDQHCLAIVGTRQATIYGMEMAKELSCELAQSGYTIISGLARGIDTASHEGALERGRTIAVLGSGLACLYPKENQALAERIKEKGAILSEFEMDAPPDRHHFPKRNRIVSGMAMGTILIEAPEKSGAMLTVERALCQGRPVFTLPGRADCENFRGNHRLIKEGKATLIENSQDILHYFNACPLPLVFTQAKQGSSHLDQEEEELLKRMPSQEVTIEELVANIQWPVSKLNGSLMSLVLKKMVKEYPGKIYKKV